MQILCLFFFLFLFKGSSKCGFFHLAVLFRFYRVLFLHHVFLSEQIKMMMMKLENHFLRCNMPDFSEDTVKCPVKAVLEVSF